MKITAFFKLTPEPDRVLPEDWARFRPDLDLGYAGLSLNCFDDSALEGALRIRAQAQSLGEAVTVQAVTAGVLPQSLTERLYALGFDRVTALEGGNWEFQPESLGNLLARAGSGSDLLLLGREAGFGETGAVPYYLGRALEIPVIGPGELLSYDGTLTVHVRQQGRLIKLRGKLPLAVTVGNSPWALGMGTLRQRLQFRGAEPQRIAVDPREPSAPRLTLPERKPGCEMLDPENRASWERIHRLLASCGKPEAGSEKPEGIFLADPEQADRETAGLLEKVKAPILLLPDTNAGRTLAPALAERTGRACFFGARELRRRENSLSVFRSCCGGNLVQEQILPLPAVGTVTEISAFGPVTKLPGGSQPPWLLEKTVLEEPGALSHARRVMICGNGMESRGNVFRSRQLAEKAGMAFGLTRPGALNGWGSPGEIVGQSGLRIHPDVCLTLGASGAGPFLEGIRGAKVILAVNRDPGALIFQAADYGIKMDAMEFLSRLEATKP